MTASDHLEIPDFLRRNKEPPKMTEVETMEGEPLPPNAADDTPREVAPEITLEMLLEQIKRLSAKRDEITETIGGLKRNAQRMIGRL